MNTKQRKQVKAIVRPGGWSVLWRQSEAGQEGCASGGDNQLK